MTDAFIEAALESAASKYQGDWDAFEQEPVDDYGFSEAERRAHVAGWEAARTHLAAIEDGFDLLKVVTARNVAELRAEIAERERDEARAHLAAQEPTDAEVYAAEVEWEHHQPYRRFSMWWCRCGAAWKWDSLEAHRQHALWHVLRAARRDEDPR